MENKDLIFLLGQLVSRIENMEERLATLDKRIQQQSDFINRWKGGAFILMGLGAFLTWITDLVLAHFK